MARSKPDTTDSRSRILSKVLPALVAALSLMSGACGSDEGNAIGDGHQVQQPGGDGGVACEAGATKACFVYVGESSGVLSCYEGVQVCEDGRYGPCQDGTVVKRLRPTSGTSGGMRVMSLSDAGSCEDNPCDPSCQVFEEEPPDGGLSLGVEGEGPQWETADILSLEDANWPPGLFRKGISEPCFSNMDCQYDQYCFEPHTAPTCLTGGGHSKCSTGPALLSTCDDCVAAVCAKMPSCCASAGASTTPGVVFEETFTNLNAQGWTLTGPWEIGAAAAGSYNDPATDTTPTADNRLAGVVIGGRYSNNSSGNLTSPVINTTGSGVLILTLRSWERFASGDYGYVEVSTNNGSTWTTLHTTTDQQSTWKSLSFDIGAYRSAQFRLRLRFGADNSDRDGGWSVDDISITDTPILFEETFSNLNAQGWTLQGQWAIGTAASGSNDPSSDTTPTADNRLAGTVLGGSYSNNLDISMISPTLDLSGSFPRTLELRSWEQFESTYDFGRIYASSNNGATWTQLYASSASDASWKSLSFDITPYASSQFQLRFRLTTDVSVVNGGWSLDDIRITGLNCRTAGNSCGGGSTCCPGLTCDGGVCSPPWSKSCIDKVGEVCGSFCPRTGTCDHTVCLTGAPLTAGCDPCVASICALDPSCCSEAWDNHCVAKVGPVCNQNCSPPAGDCRQYSPGESNPYCVGGPDLTAGVPCGNTVPICNRGDTAVAANTASFFYFPGMSQNNDFTSCSVADNFPNNAERCPIAVDIPPGECRSISCAGLGNNGGIVVNPPAEAPVLSKFPGYAPIAECSCQNNWSLFKKPGPNSPPCGEPSCLSTSVEATIPTVNMFVMFDKSGSMSGTRWNLTTQALRGFIRDPASAGLRVALRFFPGTVSGNECGGYTCTDLGCKVPQVGLGTLLAAQGTDVACGSMPSNCNTAPDPQECELIKAIRCTSPSGWTPLLVALGGSTAYMGDHAWDYPMERSVVVLVTDGYPEGASDYPANCRSPGSASFVTKAADAFAQYGVVTNTVNVVGGSATLMQSIATAGNGQYFYVSDANASTELVTALNQIRANSVSCDLILNASMGINPYDVSVSFTPSSGTATTFQQVVTAGDCGSSNSSYYYDDNQNPTKITLCPEACARVRADVGSKIDLVIGCPSHFESETYNFPYSASCPPGKKVKWGQLTWTASTPGNSSIRFEARTSEDLSTFDTPPEAGDLTVLGTAHANVAPFTGDTQTCSMFGPAPTCPVELFSRLGTPAGHYSHLELFVTLNPPSSGASVSPVLEDWNVTYSCADTE